MIQLLVSILIQFNVNINSICAMREAVAMHPADEKKPAFAGEM